MPADEPTDAAGEVYGKPFHGWSCECEPECQGYVERGEPRPGEAPTTIPAAGLNDAADVQVSPARPDWYDQYPEAFEPKPALAKTDPDV